MELLMTVITLLTVPMTYDVVEVWDVELPEPPVIRSVPTVRSVWDDLAGCESGGDWHEGDGGLGSFRGGLQWHADTWMAVKPSDAPDDPAVATREQEIAAGENLLAQSWGGWHHWPACSKKVGLR